MGSQTSEEQASELLVAEVETVEDPPCNMLTHNGFQEHNVVVKKSRHVHVFLQNIKAPTLIDCPC